MYSFMNRNNKQKVSTKYLIGASLSLFLLSQETRSISPEADTALKEMVATFEKNVQDDKYADLKYSKKTALDALATVKDSIQAYKDAIDDATTTSPDKIGKILPIVPWNKELIWDKTGEYILMAYWTSQDTLNKVFTPALTENIKQNRPVKFKLLEPLPKSVMKEATLAQKAKKALETGEWDADLETFLTAAGQVQKFIGSWINQNGLFVDENNFEQDRIRLNMRLLQYLGMPSSWKYLCTYRYFITIWVKPEDIFRPCPDTEVSDDVCHLDYFDPKNMETLSPIQQSIMGKRKERGQYTLASKISYENNFYK